MKRWIGFFLVFVLSIPAVTFGMDVKVLGDIENEVVSVPEGSTETLGLRPDIGVLPKKKEQRRVES